MASEASVGVSSDNIGQLALEECKWDGVWAVANDLLGLSTKSLADSSPCLRTEL